MSRKPTTEKSTDLKDQEIKKLKDKISYLEEVIAAQRNMLEDSVNYIQQLESTQEEDNG